LGNIRMAEGIESLANPEDLELARQASEQMGDIEMQMEYDKELPPKMQAGGIYSLFSDLGKSVPDLSYHTFGTVPKEARKSLEATAPQRAALTSRQLYDRAYSDYPDVYSGGKPVLGTYLKPTLKAYKDPERKAYADTVRAEYNLPSMDETYVMGYGNDYFKELSKPTDEIKDYSNKKTVPFVGQELADIGLNYQEFELLNLEEGKTYPGFPLGGPSIPSVNVGLNEMLLNLPEYAAERATTFQHELMHGGMTHPRFEEFLNSREFRNLNTDNRTTFYDLRYSNHDYIEPLGRYQENYQRAVDQKIAPSLFLQTDYILSPQALNEGVSKQDQDVFRKMLQAKEDGKDPVHVFVMNKFMDDKDSLKLRDLEEANAIFGNFLNKTADINTGKTTGNLYFSGVEKMPIAQLKAKKAK